MKRVFTFLLVIVIIASMTACGSNAKEKNTEASTGANINTEVNTETNNKNPNASETVEEGIIVIEDLSGKTLDTVFESGYTYVGNSSSEKSVSIYFDSDDVNDNVEKFKNSIEDMTIGELVDKYNISIGYSGFDDEYIFYIYLGTITFSCNLENGAAAREAHKDDSFFDLEEAEEIQNDKLENLVVESIRFTAELDEASCKKLSEYEDVDKKLIKKMQDELVLSKFYYIIK